VRDDVRSPQDIIDSGETHHVAVASMMGFFAALCPSRALEIAVAVGTTDKSLRFVGIVSGSLKETYSGFQDSQIVRMTASI
jgi:hypothetical protein